MANKTPPEGTVNEVPLRDEIPLLVVLGSSLQLSFLSTPRAGLIRPL